MDIKMINKEDIARLKARLPEYLAMKGIDVRSNFRCLNPEHNDNTGDMSYYRPGNCCSCHCGVNADLFTVIGWEYDLPSFRQQIAKAQEIFDGVSTVQSSVPMFEDENSEKVDDETIHRVNMLILSHLSLKEEHRQNLLKRGFTDDAIKRWKFRSVPVYKDRWNFDRFIIKEMSKLGISPEGMPGFYQKEGTWHIAWPGDGIICPVWDGEFRLLSGFQVRLDSPLKGKGKYLWVSKRGWTSVGTPCTYLPAEGDIHAVIITEGILKATLIYELLGHEITVCGVPGVGCTGGFKEILRRNPETLIIEAYDMDKTEAGKSVGESQYKLLALIESYGNPVHTLTWDKEFKGLDDFLAANPKWQKPMAQYIRRLEEENDVIRHSLFIA